MVSFLIELGQKLGLMFIQFCVLAVFAFGLGATIKWCTEPPETIAKQVAIHTIAISFIVGVGIALWWVYKEVW